MGLFHSKNFLTQPNIYTIFPKKYLKHIISYVPNLRVISNYQGYSWKFNFLAFNCYKRWSKKNILFLGGCVGFQILDITILKLSGGRWVKIWPKQLDIVYGCPLKVKCEQPITCLNTSRGITIWYGYCLWFLRSFTYYVIMI